MNSISLLFIFQKLSSLLFSLVLHCTGSSLNNIITTFQPGNNHRYTLPCVPSSNHSDKSKTFPWMNNQIPNGCLSFPDPQQSNTTT